ncbi:hypothetical protein EW146_g4081 [Bondarzewia mesenterica]|uniref:DUF1279 domain-containing protein n=1 Tax=Bondarzewia mesenterica TaxID=1095465 RepID=A0A4S4LVK5_9AGAM|nr:hypothetical protein EW146_g4081 [Bondarzewia mesenterica]
MRRIFPRFHVLRALIPRVSQPLLPVTSRFASAAETHTLTHAPRLSIIRLFHHTPARLASPPPPSPSSQESKNEPNASLTQRLKTLIKSYGWYALGMYIAISVVDFGVAFAGVNLFGAEYLSALTTSAKNAVVGMIYARPPEPGREELEDISAQTKPGGNEGLYAMIVVAYTIHKTLFLPVRVGLTAYLTPRLVGFLRTRGWAGGAGAKRAAREMRDRIRKDLD